jgi:subtilisin family serine protease
VSCGFSFPTLDGLPSIAFVSVMDVLTGPDAPRPGVAVVSPAGNESSRRAYWPAAHPDVIGVAATSRMGNARAWFSNWGRWADCCARGQDVRSTFIYWLGPVEGEPASDIENFLGWARWDGTSFAAPKVTAAIADLVAASGDALLPVDAAEQLLSGTGGVEVTPLTDMTLTPFPGVTLPHLHLG